MKIKYQKCPLRIPSRQMQRTRGLVAYVDYYPDRFPMLFLCCLSNAHQFKILEGHRMLQIKPLAHTRSKNIPFIGPKGSAD